METIWPQDEGFASLFVVGFRKDPTLPTQTQRVGAAIVKRSYGIDPMTKTVSPLDPALPIFVEDRPDNVVVNGDFLSTRKDLGEGDDAIGPGRWVDDQATSQRVMLSGVQRVAVNGSDAGGAIRQTVKFAEPIGGRTFRFSFFAQAASGNVRITGARLEAEGSASICSITTDVFGPPSASPARFDATGTWAADAGAKEIEIVLRPGFDTVTGDPVTVYYSEVQVEERSRLTKWDSSRLLYVENDLAPYKPEGDIVVAGYAGTTGVASVEIDGHIRLQRNVAAQEKSLFGWEDRTDAPRKNLVGSISTSAADYPPEWPPTSPGRDPLPVAPSPFDNRFFNGYSRAAAIAPPLESIADDAFIRIRRGGSIDYEFRLAGDSLSGAYALAPSGDAEAGPETWIDHPISMRLDTLVIEPGFDRCYVVWRGVWNFDQHDEGAYRRLHVEAVA